MHTGPNKFQRGSSLNITNAKSAIPVNIKSNHGSQLPSRDTWWVVELFNDLKKKEEEIQNVCEVKNTSIPLTSYPSTSSTTSLRPWCNLDLMKEQEKVYVTYHRKLLWGNKDPSTKKDPRLGEDPRKALMPPGSSRNRARKSPYSA